MKKVSILIPCYNEEDNVVPMSEAITNLFEKEVPARNMKTRFTPCCMLRLFADEIDELPDKILYLDNDVICRKDCQDFYNQDMEEYELARVIGLLWKMVF